MEPDELLRKAWEAVEKAGVPEPLQQVAFTEAVEYLKESSAASPGGSSSKSRTASKNRTKAKAKTRDEAEQAAPTVDEATFFSQLSSESGVPESDLRDVLSLSGNTVHVTQPTRSLGNSIAQQARTVIALVAGSGSFGLGEAPVDGEAVRTEVQRKRCYQHNNYSTAHLAGLRGFNPGGNKNEIVATSRAVGDFTAAVAQALGRADNTDES